MFEFLKQKGEKNIDSNDLPVHVSARLFEEGIKMDQIKSVQKNEESRNIDGRVFFTIILKDNRKIVVHYVGEGGYVQEFKFE